MLLRLCLQGCFLGPIAHFLDLLVGNPARKFIDIPALGQLFAQGLWPEAFVAVAGYGDLGPGYITLARSFAEGGYEPTDSFVSGEAEQIMRDAIERVMRPLGID